LGQASAGSSGVVPGKAVHAKALPTLKRNDGATLS